MLAEPTERFTFWTFHEVAPAVDEVLTGKWCELGMIFLPLGSDFFNQHIYTLMNVLRDNTHGYFTSCVVFLRAPQIPQEKFEQWVKCARLLSRKTSNKGFITVLEFFYVIKRLCFLAKGRKAATSSFFIRRVWASSTRQNKTSVMKIQLFDWIKWARKDRNSSLKAKQVEIWLVQSGHVFFLVLL